MNRGDDYQSGYDTGSMNSAESWMGAQARTADNLRKFAERETERRLEKADAKRRTKERWATPVLPGTPPIGRWHERKPCVPPSPSWWEKPLRFTALAFALFGILLAFAWSSGYSPWGRIIATVVGGGVGFLAPYAAMAALAAFFDWLLDHLLQVGASLVGAGVILYLAYG